MNLEFEGFPKIARLSRECTISEKLDGSNIQVVVGDDGQFLVGSRNRWITPEEDNYGFAKWAYENKEELMKLGVGRHFGEWVGSGINRKYGLINGEKRFYLFNTIKWCLYGTEPQRIPTNDPRIEKYQEVAPKCCYIVPVLYRGIFTTQAVEDALLELKTNGSKAVPGFTNPEGVVVYHIAGNIYFKKTIEKDESYKGEIK